MATKLPHGPCGQRPQRPDHRLCWMPAPARSARLCGHPAHRAIPVTRTCKSSRNPQEWKRQATPAGGGDGGAQANPVPRPNRAPVPLGSLPSTARRPGSAPAIRGPWHNPNPYGHLRNPRSAHLRGISLHKHLHVVFTPPDRQRAPLHGTQIRTPERRLDPHTEWPSIVPSGRADRSSSRISTRRRRQPLRPPSSSTVASSMPRMAFSTRAASRRAATTVPGGCTGRGAVSALVQFPRIVRARSSSLRPLATPTASTDKPSSRSASQSPRCRSRHEWSAVEVS